MEYIDAVRRRWLVGLLVLVTVLVPTILVNVLSPAKYTATTRLWVGVQGGTNITELSQKVSAASDLMSTYPELVKSPLVLDPVISRLNLPTDAATLAGDITATVPNDSLVVVISVTDHDATRAADTANAIAQQFSSVVSGLPQLSTSSTEGVDATVLQQALPPAGASSPQVVRNVGIALVLGIALAVIVCLVVDRYLPAARSSRDARKSGRRQPVWDHVP